MLGKLIKTEFGATYRRSCLFYILTAAITLVGGITVALGAKYTGLMESVFFEIVQKVMIALFVLVQIVMVIVLFTSACSLFNQSMYSDQGYLTHTLPVNPIATFSVKLGVSLIWLLAAYLLSGICVIFFSGASQGQSPFKVIKVFYEHRAELAEMIDALLRQISSLKPSLTIHVFNGTVIVETINLLLVIFTAMTIGQLAPSNKKGLAIWSGIGIFFLQLVVMGFTIIPGLISYRDKIVASSVSVAPKIMSAFMLITLGLYFAFDVLLYIVSALIVKHKINLQ